MKLFLPLTMFFLLIMGCSADKPDPELFFKNYIEYRFKNSPEKGILDKMSSGPYNVFINGLTDVELTSIDLTKNYQFRIPA